MININEYKAARVRRGYTQKRLAEEIGISAAKLSMKENGRIKFTVKDVGNIARALQLSADEITKIFFADVIAPKGKLA
jgi:transcriptional regulator with XRE-family HTH domain